MRIRVAQSASNTPWHFYGLTNEVLGDAAVPAAIDTLFGTGLSANRTPLNAGRAGPALVRHGDAGAGAGDGSPPRRGLPTAPTRNGRAWSPAATRTWPRGITRSARNSICPDYDAATATISMLIGVDDSLTGVRFNGANTGITTCGLCRARTGRSTSRPGFCRASTRWSFMFNNGGTADNPSGLRVQFNATAVPRLINTPVAEGPTTHYFRQEFNYDGNPAYDHAIELDGLFDDGAVFYLNGQEIYRQQHAGRARFRMARQRRPIRSRARSAPGRVSVPAAALVIGGRNVLAAEVHQSSGGNTDVRFGAELFVTETPVPPEDLPKIVINEMAAAGWRDVFRRAEERRRRGDQRRRICAARNLARPRDNSSCRRRRSSPASIWRSTEAQLGFDAADNDRFILYMGRGKAP